MARVKAVDLDGGHTNLRFDSQIKPPPENAQDSSAVANPPYPKSAVEGGAAKAGLLLSSKALTAEKDTNADTAKAASEALSTTVRQHAAPTSSSKRSRLKKKNAGSQGESTQATAVQVPSARPFRGSNPYSGLDWSIIGIGPALTKEDVGSTMPLDFHQFLERALSRIPAGGKGKDQQQQKTPGARVQGAPVIPSDGEEEAMLEAEETPLNGAKCQ